MNLTEYQHKAIHTKIYPLNHAYSYPILGLNGEIGEAVEKILKYKKSGEIMFDNSTYSFVIKETVESDLIKEIGDVFWYLACLCDEYDKKFGDVVNFDLAKFTFQVDPTRPEELDTLLFVLLLEADKMSELTKKILRDELPQNSGGNEISFEPSEEKTNKIFNHFSVIFVAVTTIIVWFNFDLVNILETNVSKLAKRKEEGKLTGSGDNR